MTNSLDPFQRSLLEDLRAVVRDGDLAPVVQPPARPARVAGIRSVRTRWIAVGVAAAALATVGVVLSSVVGAEPAYAVDGSDGTAVDVRVDRLEDAAGLEAALEEAGIRAEVLYLPEGTECAPGRYQVSDAPDPTADFAFSFGGDGYSVELAPGAIGADQTLVISAARIGDGVTGSVGIADGAVGRCVPQAFRSDQTAG